MCRSGNIIDFWTTLLAIVARHLNYICQCSERKTLQLDVFIYY